MKKKGRGMATIMFGYGYGEGFPDFSHATVEFTDDEKVLVVTAAADVGQGVLTVISQIAAEVLSVGVEKVKVIQGDTHKTMNSGSTSATRQTTFTGNAVKQACENLKGKIFHYASLEFNSNYPELTLKDGKIIYNPNPEKTITYWDLKRKVEEKGETLKGEATYFPPTYSPDLISGQAHEVYVAYTFMTQIVDVEVDTTTGKVDVKDVYTALDCGKAINPINVEGQIEGGTTQGIGMALMEEQVIKNGITLNPNMTGYLVPTSMDIPNFHSVLIENEDSIGPFGAKGIGEPTTIAASPAIANAIYDAIGIRFYELPITPEKILKALKEKEND
ncbi:xanthine dehydrogenase family protein molybdopterin-binding subunit [Petrotoga olearia]|uniref:Xanthine dehydrogenase n=2 Tax=Petrotoga olearia TaxID=156203 RepID=A0A2K1NY73_9BACT|nr:xanthine dehydrogenase [Petrotoga olearia DSM 13574]RMA72690.1 purine hydroxylase beta subunit apoprotein [Petrotoga olearia]HBT50582.1 xanthine dehydrogenase family protein molybdopterin-binding subunit [Petrotoga sp.]